MGKGEKKDIVDAMNGPDIVKVGLTIQLPKSITRESLEIWRTPRSSLRPLAFQRLRRASDWFSMCSLDRKVTRGQRAYAATTERISLRRIYGTRSPSHVEPPPDSRN